MDTKTLMKVMIAAIALIVGFVLGSMWSENKSLKQNLAGRQEAAGTGNSPAAAAPTKAGSQVLSSMPELTEEDHIRGSLDAPVILVEYSDYECPFCSRFHPTVQQVLEEYGDQVAWVYRHFPLTSIHPQAQISAEASECVAQLGGNDAFWQYTDLLFEKVGLGDAATALSEENLVAYAAQIGVSSSAVQSCLDNGETTKLVSEDAAGGRSAGITGTPGTVVVTQEGEYELISGALPFEQISSAIDAYLE
jgi:protein-disulfide isomerase